MKKYTQGQMPLTTSNAAFAFALYLAGAKFADEKQPLVHVYDVLILKALGYDSGSIEEGVEMAFTRRQKGHVEYSFQKSTTRTLAAKAFKTQEGAIAAADISARLLVLELTKGLNSGILAQAEAISASVCVILKRWRDELKEWEQHRGYSVMVQLIATKLHGKDAVEQCAESFLAGDFYAFAAVVMEARKEFLKLHWSYPPLIRVHRKGRPQESEFGKGKLVKLPGWAAYSQGLENSDRKDLGVPLK